MSLMMAAFLAAAAAVIWLLRTSHDDSARPPERSSPAGRADELLAERFARGETGEEEFRRQRELLPSRPATGEPSKADGGAPVIAGAGRRAGRR